MRCAITKTGFFPTILLPAVMGAAITPSLALCQETPAPSPSPASSSPVPGPRGPVFDVISIRPSTPGESWLISDPPDGYRVLAQPLGRTILRAYFPRILQSRVALLQGAPGWVWDDAYDVVAKVAPGDMAEWETQRLNMGSLASGTMLQKMLQAALAERCKLVVHRVPMEISGYVLVLKKHGPNLDQMKEALPDETVPPDAHRISGGGSATLPTPGPGSEKTYFQTSMASLAADLTLSWFGAVEDRTGLTGKYDFTLQKREDVSSPPPAGQTIVPATDPRPSPWNLEKLGLELKVIQIPMEGLVIDHIERPSAN
ncbi:Conserved hypothetical protein CHP03435 [Granulicella mallensis MP5ACTX8]|uniref:Uncharacterized protein n=2 Tax=Granulicella mallensis TaxID=940614 RepID=G8NV59_GRAMM|nr:Conserved hypothetical protein CHP03435 [Granulicella mallensis MP5ACTX8]